MTDNEIIKALECCKDPECTSCKECPAYEIYKDCMGCVLSEAIDLINRQKAEIEDLKDKNEHLVVFLAEAKPEAIKEFAERLNIELSLYKRECRKFLDNAGAFAIDKARQKVDKLVKEMLGEG